MLDSSSRVLSPLIHLCAGAFTTFGDDLIRISFFSKTSQDHPMTHGPEPDLQISSAGVKIIAPDVHASSNVRAPLVGRDE